jgi:AraC family transcriptional regulator
MQLNQVIDYINEHLDQDLSLNEMAAMVQMSPTYFASLFKQSTGLPPHQYVVHQRINRAKKMLLNSNLSIAEIATQLGFCDQSHLTRHMRRLLGVCPRQLRQHQE